MYTLIAVNAAIFLLGAVSPSARALMYNVGAMQTLAVMKGQVWRLVTAQYLHASFWHVALNMWALYIFGRLVESRWSTRRFFGIYTMCGLAGNLFFLLLGLGGTKWIDPATVAVGASGCIYGILGIAAILAPNVTLVLFPGAHPYTHPYPGHRAGRDGIPLGAMAGCQLRWGGLPPGGAGVRALVGALGGCLVVRDAVAFPAAARAGQADQPVATEPRRGAGGRPGSRSHSQESIRRRHPHAYRPRKTHPPGRHRAAKTARSRDRQRLIGFSIRPI